MIFSFTYRHHIIISQICVLFRHTKLIHYGLHTPYGNIHLGNISWGNDLRHQAISWTGLLLTRARDTHLKAISHEIVELSIHKICLTITYLKIHFNPLGTNEFNREIISTYSYRYGPTDEYGNKVASLRNVVIIIFSKYLENWLESSLHWMDENKIKGCELH